LKDKLGEIGDRIREFSPEAEQRFAAILSLSFKKSSLTVLKNSLNLVVTTGMML